MRVLIACEESQRVCIAFRNKGHYAFSCDLQPCSGGHPEWHIKGDVLHLLNGNCGFTTEDGNADHFIIGKWDLIIAHPPCTRLCNSGQRWLYYGDEEYRNKKLEEQRKGIEFFMKFTTADCDKIVIENPMGIMSTLYRKPDVIYNPYDFVGETDCKKTCLWLKGVPPLKSNRDIPLPKNKRTNNVWLSYFNGKYVAWNSPECAKHRSKTPIGVANAMAEQWG